MHSQPTARYSNKTVNVIIRHNICGFLFAGCECDAEPASTTAVSVSIHWLHLVDLKCSCKTQFDSLSPCHCVVSMSGMMSNAVGGPAAGVGGLSDISSLIEA